MTGEKRDGPRQVLDADKVAEPKDDSVVHLLDALPDDERHRYADEASIVEAAGRSHFWGY